MWGYDPGRYARAPLLDALDAGPGGGAPKLKVAARRPALVPAHPDLAHGRISDKLVADCLLAWAGEWAKGYVVVDTHPGANPLTDGAMQAADLIVVPVILGAREMDALEGMLAQYSRYRLLLVPYMVGSVPPRRFVERLAHDAAGTPVAPLVSEHRWLRRRLRRAAVTLELTPGARVRAAASEFRQVAAKVEEILGQ